MPQGQVLGEFTLKAMSVRQSEIGGGHRRIEVDLGGESSGEVPGQNVGTLVIEASTDPTRANPFTYTGVLLAKSGAVVQISGSGIGVRTGEGHKARYRGAGRYATENPKLAAFNNMISMVEFETDPATMTLKGTSWEWK
jgi:hypothetical protein